MTATIKQMSGGIEASISEGLKKAKINVNNVDQVVDKMSIEIIADIENELRNVGM